MVTVWSYAKKRGYCSDETAKNIVVAKEIEKPIEILRPGELANLLAIAPPDMLPGLAIGAFAGLRVSEVCRLDWSEINLQDGFIEVTAAKAKSARRRLTADTAALLKEAGAGVYFDWWPDSSCYLTQVEKQPPNPHPEQFLELLGLK